jgi:uncharacterized protein GlcG (DUF336 family)
MTTRFKLLILPIYAVSAVQLFIESNAAAQVGISGYSLPLNLANEAAIETVRICEASGFAVSVAVVDASGLVKVQLKGDHSTVHTKDTSFRKAYTLVTMGPVFGLGSGSEFADVLRSNPKASALQQIPDIISLPGSVAIRAHGEIVAGIGVGGAPGGEKDEVCARAGLAKSPLGFPDRDVSLPRASAERRQLHTDYQRDRHDC